MHFPQVLHLPHKTVSMRPFKTLLLLLFISPFVSLSAQYTIRGQVTDEGGTPMIGASIVITGTTIGTATDPDGNYEIKLDTTSGKYRIEAAYTGYLHSEKTLLLQRKRLVTLDFVLEPGAALEEVVATKARRRKKLKKSTMILDSAEPRMLMELPARPEAERYSDAVEIAAFDRLGNTDGIQAGTLTAGEIHDFSKWELWNDIVETDLEMYQKNWKMYPSNRFTVQLTTENGAPVRDAAVHLYQGQNRIWSARSDNTGKAELWADLFQKTAASSGGYSAKVSFAGEEYELPQLTQFQGGINHLVLPQPCQLPREVDILFVVDATGSMGDEIRYLQAELADVLERTKASDNSLDLRLGSVFYRDKEDEYLTRKHDLTPDIASTINFIKAQQADGGGDYPEAMDEALNSALEEISWRDQALTKLLFLVMDAPPHGDDATIAKMHRLTERAAAQGIRIIPVSGSGIDKSTEYLVRSMALATNGTYVFLTDHSGIGNPHLEPTTDNYDVEKFNDLLVRLIGQYTEGHVCEEPIAIQAPKDPDTPDTQQRSLHCYPNPTSGIFYVELESQTGRTFFDGFSGKNFDENRRSWSPGPSKLIWRTFLPVFIT